MNHITSPYTSENYIEQEIRLKKPTAPRVQLSDIHDSIISEHYFTGAQGCAGNGDQDLSKGAMQSLGLLTFCVLVLRNGFTVTGESACASPENFNAEIGYKIARENAIQKIWPLMGYQLKQNIFQQVAQYAA